MNRVEVRDFVGTVVAPATYGCALAMGYATPWVGGAALLTGGLAARVVCSFPCGRWVRRLNWMGGSLWLIGEVVPLDSGAWRRSCWADRY